MSHAKKYKNKYRVQSTRLPHWDYGWKGVYFVTLCTLKKYCYFGHVIDGIMCLSKIGNIVKQEWCITPAIRPDMNLQLGDYVVMPNHFHGIVIIGENKFNRFKLHKYHHSRDAMHRISTTNKTIDKPVNEFGPQSKNLASIMRGFKSSVTKKSRKIHKRFAWQPGFYEHIVRNEKSLERISNYIVNNPEKWQADPYSNTGKQSGSDIELLAK